MKLLKAMSKEDKILLLICMLIGIVMAGITGRFLCQSRLEIGKEQARGAFCAALQEELRKWKGIDVCISSSGNKQLPDDSIDINKESVKVTLDNGHGDRDYWIPYEKRILNIEQSDDDVRAMHTCLLHDDPLNADSLNQFWQKWLAESGLSGVTFVRIAEMDWEEYESCTYSADTLYLSKADSLSAYYIGCRCEVEVTGYLYRPWWVAFSWKDWGLLVVVFVGCSLLFFVRKCFVKKKSVVIENTPESHLHVLQLEEGASFDIDLRMLKKGDYTMLLTPQLAQLLQGFLEAKNYRLSTDEIQLLLWPCGNGTPNKVYQNVKRLRKSLSKISSSTIVNEHTAYQLNIPISSGKIHRKKVLWHGLTLSDIV